MASATTDLPRPSTQLTAAGFLSVQKLPLRLTTSMSGNTSNIRWMANSVALLNMFLRLPGRNPRFLRRYRPGEL